MGALRAQTAAPAVIGWLSTSSADSNRRQLAAFNEGMAALGWRVGTQYRLEERHADGRVERLPTLAQELAAKKPAVILAFPSAAVRAAAEAAPLTPVVRVAGDSALTGLVHSLARPGGMVTGLSSVADEMHLKTIELLVETLPKLQRVGFLADAASGGRDANVAAARRAAERFRFEAVVVDMAKPEDIEPALARLAKAKVQALEVLPSTWLGSHTSTFVQFAQAQRVPMVGLAHARSGALFSYGPDGAALARRAAYYVDRILKGAKPGDLPIEQPTVFELALNMKVAKALGITVPQSMLLRATEVIE
jgi:putative tryptophan/tyrosine transport system substrate-binding protein